VGEENHTRTEILASKWKRERMDVKHKVVEYGVEEIKIEGRRQTGKIKKAFGL
jgi:hypothetical protein